MSSRKHRKQVYELTIADFERFGVWEYALDEEGHDAQDEATVRPREIEEPLDPAEGTFIVRARFTLADETQMGGFLTPPDREHADLGALQPVICAPKGQVNFWYGALALKRTEIVESYRRLGTSSSKKAFPIHFESDVWLIDGVIEGEIPGFLVLGDLPSMRTRVVR